MFKSRTVFVVGAGASDEAGLPIGKSLTKDIARLVDIQTDSFGGLTHGDHQIYGTIMRVVRHNEVAWVGNTLFSSARHIAEAMEMAISIDTFLESFADDRERKLISKLGIAKAIISAERKSKFAPREHNRPFKLRDVANTWYVSLAQLLFSGVPASTPHLAFENVSFIVFNYDRCLQVFLTRALEAYFEITEGVASAIVRNVKFFHPYGNLGGIFPGDQPHVAYGAEHYDLLSIAENINTFSESVTDSEILSTVRSEVRQAETLVFLGFAFHDQNMEVLSAALPRGDIAATKRVLATVYGMSNSDTEIVTSLVGQLISSELPQPTRPSCKISTFNGKCAPFFAEYWRSLTAS